MLLRLISPLALLATPLSATALANLIELQGIDILGPVECPAGWIPEKVGAGSVCVRGNDVLGPFPEVMVEKCIAWGGGQACRNDQWWHRSVAIPARGTDVCPQGAVWDPVTTYCVESDRAYGPFPKALVTRCENGGGGKACGQARWNRDFLVTLLGSGARLAYAKAQSIECPSGWTWMALGLTGGGLCVHGNDAMGPFSSAMAHACVPLAGESCHTHLTWERDLAARLHEKARCAPGTQFDEESGYCREDDDVFGPFPSSLVERCIASGGGDSTCKSARWGREFLLELKGSPRESDPFLDFRLPEPEPALVATTLKLWATNYYLPMVDAVASGHPLRNRGGEPLGPLLTTRDWCNSAMEGSVHVRTGPGSGRTYNFDGTTAFAPVNCSHMFPRNDVSGSKFRVARGQFGDGVQGYKLVPFRTIAVDPDVIPYGSLIYIPEARGLSFRLPDGRRRVHDGYFFAADTGGAIRNSHIDVFTGTQESDVFEWIRSDPAGTFEAWVVKGEANKVKFEHAHR